MTKQEANLFQKVKLWIQLLSNSQAWKRFKKEKLGIIGLIGVLTLCFISIFAPIIAPQDPNKIVLKRKLEPPSLSCPLGRDEVGRDELSRLIYGARTSLIIGLSGVLITSMLGVVLGVLAGYYGGALDEIISRSIDIIQAYPGILIAIVIATIIGPGMINVIIAVSIAGVSNFARITRGTVLSVKNLEYVEAARAIGENDKNIILRYILPNIWAPVIVQFTLRIAGIILTASGLSFLGLGVPPPTAEWGLMMSSGRNYLRVAPHIVVIPGTALILVVLSFNILGDAIRDVLDPRLRGLG